MRVTVPLGEAGTVRVEPGAMSELHGVALDLGNDVLVAADAVSICTFWPHRRQER